MVDSLSLNVKNAWDNREALGIDQRNTAASDLFVEQETKQVSKGVDVSNTSLEEVEKEIQTTQDEIESLNQSKEKNNQEIGSLQKEIQSLKQQISQQINDSIAATKNFTEMQQEKIKQATEEAIEEYTRMNGQMTEEQMQANLAQKIGSIDTALPAFITAMLTSANTMLLSLTNRSQKIANLQLCNQNITKQVNAKCAKLENLNLQKTELERIEAEKKKCDPIGFVTDGKICDFIIDRNDDNKFNNEKEFLGAENNWAEMIALDKNGNNDGKVSADEMEQAGVKVLVTNADGSQEIVSVADLGVEEVDLSSFKGTSEELNDGNILLGTFGLTINGESSLDGYNTLDTIGSLDKHYSNMFTDKAEQIGRFAVMPEEITDENGFNANQTVVDIYTLRSFLTQAKESINFSINNLAQTKANALKTPAPALTIETEKQAEEKKKEEEKEDK